MTKHLYLSLFPEALIASMLPPEEFGTYYAVGTHKKTRGQAMFIELDPTFRHEFLRIDKGVELCIPHEDGRPKKSVYISTYRVLEHVPISMMKRLYLVSAYGEVLGLDPSEQIPEPTKGAHMYQEISPVQPLIVTTLGPSEFHQMITMDAESLIHLPAIAFVELQLGELATDPEYGAINDLPYAFIHHLRECIMELETKQPPTKMVNRVQPVEFPYRMIQSGLYVGNMESLLFFPLPSRSELRSKYYRWWRSANL
ncbi:MAG: hypothetical protein DWQ04_09840 [Chloroflexi bacterium]|nr:MAG: hypothetical protein DWQ04_09840 [Chloroflexota bacterium]